MLEIINEYYYYLVQLINNFSNISLNAYIILSIAVVFLALYKLRNYPILSTISVGFSFFPVLIHELGHAFASQLIGGQVDDIRMILSNKKQQEAGKQGYAITRANHRFKFIFITFFGYVAPPLMLLLGVYLVHKGFTFIFLFLCIFFLVFYFVQTKQKWIPLILLIIVGYCCYNIIFQHQPLITNSTSILYNTLLGLLLGETVQSVFITTKTTFSKNAAEWDGSALKSLTHIPTIIWWLLWTLISVTTIYNVLIIIFSR
ncbi:M50 family metallopeptidase [Staphylococcus xylosus]|uniref:M50 family metallopeptidase n=1 Tax=Staphylococcus xylosus TaxID=1288 RepID=UPI0011CC52E2|nr:M50 family metallopeptidase [Staphylococcus xylosus]